eukprot:1160870-Pelagomonas_calceolata.AAC.2
MLLDGCCAAARPPLAGLQLPPLSVCNVLGAAQQDAYTRSTYNIQEVRVGECFGGCRHMDEGQPVAWSRKNMLYQMCVPRGTWCDQALPKELSSSRCHCFPAVLFEEALSDAVVPTDDPAGAAGCACAGGACGARAGPQPDRSDLLLQGPEHPCTSRQHLARFKAIEDHAGSEHCAMRSTMYPNMTSTPGNMA